MLIVLTMLVGKREIGQYNDDCRPDTVSCLCNEKAVVLDEHVVGKALQKADGYRGVTGDGGNLFLAFLALILAHALECGDCNAQQLDDDGCVDVRLDAQGENRCLRKCTAGHDVQQPQNSVLQRSEVALQSSRVDIRYRDCITDTENKQNNQCEQDLLANLLYTPCVL